MPGRDSLAVRVFVSNAALMVAAVALFALSPATVSAPIALREALVVGAGLGVMLVLNLTLTRLAFAPLERLTAVMRRVDLRRPGLRIPAYGDDVEVAELTDAFNQMLDRLEAERQDSVRAALSAQESERRRIARELHDEIGQSLTAMALRLEAAMRSPDGASRDDLEQLHAIATHSVEEVRTIARRLRPEMLDDLGLVTALVALTEGVEGYGGLRVERSLDSSLESLGEDEDLVVFRVAQEGLTNVVRHADARTVRVRFGREAGHAVLEVEDDGRGAAGPLVPGSGIQGMAERANLIGASLDVGAPVGGGVRVRLAVPLR